MVGDVCPVVLNEPKIPGKFQGCSRVMSRPAGRVRSSSRTRMSDRVGSGIGLGNPIGPDPRVFNPTRDQPCKVLFESEWHGVFTGHDPTRGSHQEVFKNSRVGLGRVGPSGVGSGSVTPSDPTRES